MLGDLSFKRTTRGSVHDLDDGVRGSEFRVLFMFDSHFQNISLSYLNLYAVILN